MALQEGLAESMIFNDACAAIVKSAALPAGRDQFVEFATNKPRVGCDDAPFTEKVLVPRYASSECFYNIH